MTTFISNIGFYPKTDDDETISILLFDIFEYSLSTRTFLSMRTLKPTYEYIDFENYMLMYNIDCFNEMALEAIPSTDIRQEARRKIFNLYYTINKKLKKAIKRDFLKFWSVLDSRYVTYYHDFLKAIYENKPKNKIMEHAFKTWGYHNFNNFYNKQIANTTTEIIFNELKLIETEGIIYMI